MADVFEFQARKRGRGKVAYVRFRALVKDAGVSSPQAGTRQGSPCNGDRRYVALKRFQARKRERGKVAINFTVGNNAPVVVFQALKRGRGLLAHATGQRAGCPLPQFQARKRGRGQLA